MEFGVVYYTAIANQTDEPQLQCCSQHLRLVQIWVNCFTPLLPHGTNRAKVTPAS